jgi:hypothetical protein
MYKDNDIINLEKDGKFTEAHASRNQALVSQEAYPWLYDLDNDPDSCLTLKNKTEEGVLKYELVNTSSISRRDTGTNTAWEGDANPEYGRIKASMHRGFKLIYPPIALFQDSRVADGNLTLIDGRTTDSILYGTVDDGTPSKDGWGYKNLIADTYGVKEGPNPSTGEEWTQEEILDEISIFGQAANTRNNDPKGKTNRNSFLKEFVRIYRKKLECGRYLKEFDSSNPPRPLLSVIEKRMDRVMGNSGYGPKEREELCYEIRNQFEAEGVVRAFKTVIQAKTWLTTGGRNFVDKPPVYVDGKLTHKGIMYLPIGSSGFRSAIVKAASTWNKNKDCKIRVIIETEILTGYSYTTTYWKRLRTFREYWYNTLNILSSAYFCHEASSFRNIELYGAIPAYNPIHDLDKLVFVTKIDESESSEDLDEDASDDEIMSNDEAKHWKQK